MSEPANRAVGSFWRLASDAPARVLPVALVLRLQQTVGNGEVTRLLQARHRPLPGKPVEVRTSLPVWVYVLAAIAGALIGSTAALLAGVSIGALVGVAAGGALVGIGATYFIQRSRNLQERSSRILQTQRD